MNLLLPGHLPVSGGFLQSPYLSSLHLLTSPASLLRFHVLATQSPRTFKRSLFFTSDLNRHFDATSASLSTGTQPRDVSVFHSIIRLRFVFGRADSSAGVMIAVLAPWSSDTAEQVIAHAARPLLLQQGYSDPIVYGCCSRCWLDGAICCAAMIGAGCLFA